jgi:hypothetical protein
LTGNTARENDGCLGIATHGVAELPDAPLDESAMARRRCYGKRLRKPIHEPFRAESVCHQIGIIHRHKSRLRTEMDVASPRHVVFDHRWMIGVASRASHGLGSWPWFNRSHLGHLLQTTTTDRSHLGLAEHLVRRLREIAQE